MDLAAHPFQWANGATTSGGFAKITSAGLAGGSGNEITVNNLLLSVSVGFGQSLQAAQVSFGEYGGNINISINNHLVNVANFADIHGTIIGGVTAKVSGGLGNDKGRVVFIGTMGDQASGLGQLAVGGQELWLDDICVKK